MSEDVKNPQPNSTGYVVIKPYSEFEYVCGRDRSADDLFNVCDDGKHFITLNSKSAEVSSKIHEEFLTRCELENIGDILLQKIILYNTNPTISFNLEINGNNVSTSKFDSKNKYSYFDLTKYKKNGFLETLITASIEPDDSSVNNRMNYLRTSKLHLNIYPNQKRNFFYYPGHVTVNGLYKDQNGNWIDYEKDFQYGNSVETIKPILAGPIKELFFQSSRDFEVSLRFGAMGEYGPFKSHDKSLRLYFSGFGKEFQNEVNRCVPEKYNKDTLNFSCVYDFSIFINTPDYKITRFKYSIFDIEKCEEQNFNVTQKPERCI